MKFTMFVRPAGTKSPAWREDYDFDSVLDMGRAVDAAIELIVDWNMRGATKRRRHNGMIEKRREVVAVEFNGERREFA
jgi:hypothetical protein